MEEKRRYKTFIAGRSYTIVAKKPVEHLKTVSEIANERILQLMQTHPDMDLEQRAILTAVNTISELLSKQQEFLNLKKEHDEVLKRLDQMEKRMKTIQSSTRSTEGKKNNEPKQVRTKKPAVKPVSNAQERMTRVAASKRTTFQSVNELPEASRKKLEQSFFNKSNNY